MCVSHFFVADLCVLLSVFFSCHGAPLISGRESLDLYHRRHQMDWLSIARPPCIGLLKRFLNWMKYHILEKGKMASLISSSVGLSRMFSNVVEGLSEIQLNNLQQDQLATFDAMAGAMTS